MKMYIVQRLLLTVVMIIGLHGLVAADGAGNIVEPEYLSSEAEGSDFVQVNRDRYPSPPASTVGHDDYMFEFSTRLKYLFFSGLDSRKWDNNTLEWWYNPSNQMLGATEEIVQAIQAAAASWEAVSGIDFVYMGTTNQGLSNDRDDMFVIGWLDQNTFENRFGNFSGYTYIWWDSSGIVDGELSLNLGDWSYGGNLLDFQGLMTHELGHAIGIDHSDEPESIMYASPYHSYEYQRTLREDDINAVQSLYPDEGCRQVPHAQIVFSDGSLNSSAYYSAYDATLNVNISEYCEAVDIYLAIQPLNSSDLYFIDSYGDLTLDFVPYTTNHTASLGIAFNLNQSTISGENFFYWLVAPSRGYDLLQSLAFEQYELGVYGFQHQ